MSIRMLRFLWLAVLALAACAPPVAPAPSPSPAGPPARIRGVIRFTSAPGVKFPPVALRLMDPTQDQNAPEAVVGTTQTDENGQYAFADLKPGRYSLGLTAAMPDQAGCNPPSLLRQDQWLIGASYASGEQEEIIPTLLAVWDAAIEAGAGDDLEYNLELAIPCHP